MPRKIGREKARWLALPRYYTGEPCIHEHIAERYTKSGACTECVIAFREVNRKRIKELDRARYWANPEKSSEKCKTYYAANKKKVLKKSNAYKAANKKALKKYHKAYYTANRDEILKQQKISRAAKRKKR